MHQQLYDLLLCTTWRGSWAVSCTDVESPALNLRFVQCEIRCCCSQELVYGSRRSRVAWQGRNHDVIRGGRNGEDDVLTLRRVRSA